jgi:hypothetical protein
MAVAVVPGDRFAAGEPYTLFKIPGADGGYQALADGQHFIEWRNISTDDSRLPIVVVNWPNAVAISAPQTR